MADVKTFINFIKEQSECDQSNFFGFLSAYL